MTPPRGMWYGVIQSSKLCLAMRFNQPGDIDLKEAVIEAATAELLEYFSDARVQGIELERQEAEWIAGGIARRVTACAAEIARLRSLHHKVWDIDHDGRRGR